MFKLIPGKLPKLSCVKAIGVATGELTRAMYDVKLDMQSPTAPYYDIYKVSEPELAAQRSFILVR